MNRRSKAEELEYVGTVDASLANEEPYILGVFECPEPDCDATICEWCDCPECLWYDGDVWEQTMNGPLEGCSA